MRRNSLEILIECFCYHLARIIIIYVWLEIQQKKHGIMFFHLLEDGVSIQKMSCHQNYHVEVNRFERKRLLFFFWTLLDFVSVFDCAKNKRILRLLFISIENEFPKITPSTTCSILNSMKFVSKYFLFRYLLMEFKIKDEKQIGYNFYLLH